MAVELDKALAEILRANAEAFIRDHADEAIGLGADLAKAVLAEAILDAGVVLPQPLPEDASVGERATQEELLLSHSERVQLIAAAELEQAERIAKMKKAAADVALKVGSQISAALVQAFLASLAKKAD